MADTTPRSQDADAALLHEVEAGGRRWHGPGHMYVVTTDDHDTIGFVAPRRAEGHDVEAMLAEIRARARQEPAQ